VGISWQAIGNAVSWISTCHLGLGDLKTGEVKWKWTGDVPAYAFPVVDGNHLFVRDNTNLSLFVVE
jgi:hypothetical protein